MFVFPRDQKSAYVDPCRSNTMSYPADLDSPKNANHKNIREPLGPKTHKIFQGNSPGRCFRRILYLFKEL